VEVKVKEAVEVEVEVAKVRAKGKGGERGLGSTDKSQNFSNNMHIYWALRE
jgi:hypothetical protein